MPSSPLRAATGTAKQMIDATSLEWCPRPTRPGHHIASADLGEIAVHKAFLHVFHLAPIDALGPRVVAVRQELVLDRVRQLDRTCGPQICVGPDRLALV